MERNRKRFTFSYISIKPWSITNFILTQSYITDILFTSPVPWLVLESIFKTNDRPIFAVVDKAQLDDDFHP